MAMALNVASPGTSSVEVVHAESSGVLESVAGPEELGALPFFDDDPCGQFGEREPRVRDRGSINCVAVECWKALRITKTHAKSTPKDLSLFPNLQLDIVLEVLGHLHPLDLIHVARVNKAFRGLLHAPISAGIWRSAFVVHPPLPTCPPHIPGRRWAKLLFGPRQCDECGASNASPDHKIYRRLCTSCMNRILFNGVPKYSSSHEVNTLLAKTFRLDGSRAEGESDVGRIWPADGTAVAEEYERIKAADDPVTLEAFIEERKNAVQKAEELAEQAERWSDKVFDDSLLLFDKQLRRVVKSARKRLVQEGHDPRDVNAVQDFGECPLLEHIPRLTSKRWNKARPHVLPLVEATRATRLTHEREQLLAARERAVSEAASCVLRTAPAASWAYRPPGYAIETFEPLRALVDEPSDAPLTADDPRLADALVGLPRFVRAWQAEKRALLASLLPPAPASSPLRAINADVEADEDDARRLALATSVFTCLGSWVGARSVAAGRALIGWEGAGAHLRCRSLQRYWENRVHYAPEGAEAAVALLALVGLDPEWATAGEMDAVCVQKRFLCVLCPLEGYKRVQGRRAMRWRECVQHTIECRRIPGNAAHDGRPVWALLTDAGAKEVRRREKPDPVAFDAAWVCALCPEHFDERVTLGEVTRHVRDGHFIRTPVEGVHYICFPGAERTARVPVLLSQERNVAEFRCNRCPLEKLRSLRAIGRHVTDKHKVVAPSDADWTRVELILRTTPMPLALGEYD
ncbi:hypothetical protein B0H11DRAFT_2435477 [Mycena galericulata]|nr:hypothetical protein B0H11DRAFT_2435477 [Mycena galericulata]